LTHWSNVSAGGSFSAHIFACHLRTLRGRQFNTHRTAIEMVDLGGVRDYLQIKTVYVDWKEPHSADYFPPYSG